MLRKKSSHLALGVLLCGLSFSSVTFADKEGYVDIKNVMNIYPKQIQNILKKTYDECREYSDIDVSLFAKESAIQHADFTGDGIHDYLINYVDFSCGDDPSLYGHHESLVDLFKGSTSGDFVNLVSLSIPVDGPFELVKNDKGYYDFLVGARGEACGQKFTKENPYCFACAMGCTQQQRWDEKKKDMKVIKQFKDEEIDDEADLRAEAEADNAEAKSAGAFYEEQE